MLQPVLSMLTETIPPTTTNHLPRTSGETRQSRSVIVDLDEHSVQRLQRNMEDWHDAIHQSEEITDPSTLSVLKALGRQGVSVRSYDGTGGCCTLKSWNDSLLRYFRLYNIRGGDNQVTIAVCFLSERAKDWWERLSTTGQ